MVVLDMIRVFSIFWQSLEYTQNMCVDSAIRSSSARICVCDAARIVIRNRLAPYWKMEIGTVWYTATFTWYKRIGY